MCLQMAQWLWDSMENGEKDISKLLSNINTKYNVLHTNTKKKIGLFGMHALQLEQMVMANLQNLYGCFKFIYVSLHAYN